ncbi:fasciclin domain-containing protein [Winogradskyella jejuensis]|uniref:Uncaracterized surface protein containing fasciclin (FAS1) repeats n=1 Tax=Winogradskyella jejuensis TaxID=1089305 RepID=A0A1M5KSU3_9FLAO|nr:fasciclin domain-containing protein [Winogradskyella jejuensis]SHG55233.1 Uncaracterized surface protein containing fasciclin (FAS1) repeats [Winogradskyella jejuensis]
MKTIHLFKLIPVAVLLVFFYSCKNETSQSNTSVTKTAEAAPQSQQGQAFVEDNVSNPNVLQIAIKSPDHTTLVAAVQAAQLENALVNAGPLMVFAPTNAAFEALPSGTVENLLKPENKETLATILKHHVTAGNYDMNLLKKVKKLGQADDTSVQVETKGDDIYVGGAKIIGTVKASNGTIYVVDKVILPQ